MSAPRSRRDQIAELVAARDRLDARIAMLARGLDAPAKRHERSRPVPPAVLLIDEAMAHAAPGATAAQIERLTILALSCGTNSRAALIERRRRRAAKNP